MTRKTWTTLVVFSLLILMFLINAYIGSVKDDDIKKNMAMNFATVTFYSAYGHGGTSIGYVYFVDGKKYSKSTACSQIKQRYGDSLVGRQFPLLYSNKNFNHSSILIFPEDFHHFGIPFPDSLN
jgi:hypothetical protein